MKKFFVSSALFFSAMFFGCSNSGTKKQDDGTFPYDTSKGVSAMAHDSLHKSQSELVYVCPCGNCPEVRESKSGNCPKCGLQLVEEKKCS